MRNISWMVIGAVVAVAIVFGISFVRGGPSAVDGDTAELEGELIGRDLQITELEQVIKANTEDYLAGAALFGETFNKAEEASVRNQQEWLEAERQWIALITQLQVGQVTLAESFVSFIDTVANTMADPKWPLFLCDFVKKNYVVDGLAESEGTNCQRIQREEQ